ncbi:MAG: winged helix-turn-helix transcriptional regulator [Anaerolineales bacterium]|nr:winged helix-turn-helix transcriptional regulator [Anaerolineales bacterium]MBX3038983.1 winged helix-turn-helix transcriptional regulator [Anaerolineales bacterium]
MLEAILGSAVREKVLLFILIREKGYSTEIASFFNISLSQIQKQMDGLEAGGIFVSQNAGRTRVYEFNPRYPFLKELKPLLEKALTFYPKEIQENLLMNRRRPRRRNKPL